MALPDYAMRQASFPELYERWLAGTLFKPWSEIAFDAVGLSPADRVLDIACGTGIAARVARERIGEAGSIVGIDISSDMLSVARRIAPDIEWRQGEATALPLNDDEQFDVVICQQGMQFFADKMIAASQMRRALRAGGRLAVTTWRPDTEVPFFQELRHVAERKLGPIADARYAYGEAGPIHALLSQSGFSEVRVDRLARPIRFEDGGMFVRLNAMALVGMSAQGKMMSEAERKRAVDEIVSDSTSVLEDHGGDRGLSVEVATNLATARG